MNLKRLIFVTLCLCTFLLLGRNASAQLTVTTSTIANVSCNAGNNGSVGVSNITGGTSPYTYMWSDPSSQTTDTATGLTAGSYTVNVTDINGNTGSAVASISQPNALSITATDSMNVSCNGGNNGIASSTLSGGTSPYTYMWSDANSQATATATGLTAGTYTLTVTDSCGGSTSASVNINQPNALSASASVTTNVSCNGGSDGSASASNSGGTSPYTYMWSDANSQATVNATGLMAGTYTVTISDSCGATASASVTISQPNLLNIASTSVTNVTCNSGNNGSAMVTASDGSTPYAYLWSDANSQATATATGLTAGSYTVSVSDACGTTVTAGVSITEPTALTLSTSTLTNESCNGGNIGSASASAGGGTAPYNYMWSDANSQATATATGLTAGTYTVTITDNNGCTTSATATVTEPTALVVAATDSMNVSCNGGTNGITTSVVSGGTAPYAYLWSDANSQATATATGLTAGSYSLTVTDNNGCSTTASASVNQPSAVSLSASVTSNVTCNGGNTGSASSSVSGGTSPFTYMWSDANSQATVNATGLVAGSYTVTVTDSCGGTASASVTITQPSALIISASTLTNVSCNAGNNGSAMVTASNGSTPYTYLWSDANSQTTATATGLNAGSYTVTVNDNCGATLTASVNITQPTALIISASTLTNVSCNAGNNGSAMATASNGSTPYTYLWSDANSQATATATGLNAGSYTVTVNDNCGATLTASVNITQPVALTASASTVTNVTCNGGGNGYATSTVGGGTIPYTYSWSNGGGSSSYASDLSAGTYTVNVTDNNGCTISASTTITQPTAIVVTAYVTSNITCHGDNNGGTSSFVSGGISPYTYLWSDANSQATPSANGLSAGTYTLKVTDNNGCIATASTTVTQPAVLAVTATVVSNNNCFGDDNGDAMSNVTGGTSPYNYSWSDPNLQVTQSATGLSAGSYTVNIIDNNGCTTSAAITITQPAAALTVTASITSNVNCNGGNNGSASSVVNGGTVPYTYTWSAGGSNATISNLTAGTYTLNVVDLHGCSNSASITITQPASALSLSAVVTANVTCNAGDNGSAVTVVNGGTGPYTYAWTPAGGNNATATGLTAGAYTVTLTDNHGCTESASIAITQPLTAISLTAVQTASVTCNGGNDGKATSSVSGGVSPYTYSWSVGGTNASISNLTAGTYVLTVEDFNGCTSSTNVTIMQPSFLSLNASITNNVACNGGSDAQATSSVSGGVSPYTYSWVPAGGNASVASGLSAGTYTINITDSHGCTNSATVNITQPAAISMVTNSKPDGGSGNGTAWVHVSGGEGPYHYSWSPGGGATDSIFGKSHGTYCCTVTDANGCESSACVTINLNTGVDNIASGSAQISVYPNPNNGLFTIQSSVANGTASVEIYNILGKEIYTIGMNADKNGNTTIDISNQPNGIYLYRIISNEDGSLLGNGKIILQK